jgi:hypothetical protein
VAPPRTNGIKSIGSRLRGSRLRVFIGYNLFAIMLRVDVIDGKRRDQMSAGISTNEVHQPPRERETTQRWATASNWPWTCRPRGRFVSGQLVLGLVLSLAVWGGLTGSSSMARGEVESEPGFLIPPQPIRLRSGDRVIEGQVTVRLLEAIPEDDSLRAFLALQFPPPDTTGEPPGSVTGIPSFSSFSQEVRLNWVKGTACPTLRLRVPPLEARGGETAVPLPSFTLRIDETEVEISRLLCSWTRQINAQRSRLGIIRALNRLLLPEEVAAFAPSSSSRFFILIFAG